MGLSWCTVCFFSFGIFYDDVTPRVLEIIEFWKKFLEDIGNAFYDVKFAGLFYKNLNHLTGEEMLIKISQNHHFLKFLAEQIFFKMRSFLNGLSYRYQIGPKLKLICSNFKKYKEGNFSLVLFYIRHEGKWCLNWNFDQDLIQRSLNHLRYEMSISTQVVPKTPSKYLPFEPNLVSVAQTV